jgi:hypothetical protein
MLVLRDPDKGLNPLVVISYDYFEADRVVCGVSRPFAPCAHVYMIVVPGLRRAPIYAGFAAACQMEELQTDGTYKMAFPELLPERQRIFDIFQKMQPIERLRHPHLRLSVPGYVAEDIRYGDTFMTVNVTPKEVDKILAYIDQAKRKTPEYRLLSCEGFGINCSGFVLRALAAADIKIPSNILRAPLVIPWPAMHARAVDARCVTGRPTSIGRFDLQPSAATLAQHMRLMQPGTASTPASRLLKRRMQANQGRYTKHPQPVG